MSSQPRALPLRIADTWEDYRLIDSGAGQKLERFGSKLLIRPEPQAIWPKTDHAAWATADAAFEGADGEERGRWSAEVGDFPVRLGPVTMVCRLTNNQHVGLFPEQRPHWEAAGDALKGADAPHVLNLFGYTGAASLLLAANGAHVTHVDASKKAIAWGKESQSASSMDDAPIRWICDDAQKFVAREVRRGRKYQGILLDPPKFGRGPKNETWDFFEGLAPLLTDIAQLVADDARFVILTAYALRTSALAVGRTLDMTLSGRGGRVEAGELAIPEATGRLLPTSMYAEWRP